MLYLYQSNRLENLAQMLATLHTSAPIANPFAPEHIIVQSQGMRRFISQYLAQHTGIAANLHFALPAGLAWRLMREAVPNIPELSPFSSEVMRWRLLDLFQSPEFATPDFQAAYTVLHDYWQNGAYAQYQLAGQLADIFDQYLVYRPDWIEAWAAGKSVPHLAHENDAIWQAQLWRYLDNAQQNVPHRVQLWRTLMDKLADEQHAAQLPERYFVFGIAALAPMYLKLLEQIALHRDVHIFALNPSDLYWGNVLEPAQILRLGDAADLSIQGHPLLASLGKQGRDFFNELSEVSAQHEITSFAEKTVSGCLLHSIQHHIQTQTLPENAYANGWLAAHHDYLAQHVFPQNPDLAARFQAAVAEKMQPENPIAQLNADHSLQIHAAHSPLRELQILKDRLLDLLHRHPDWQAHDIAVLTPNIEPYAPYIEAVFGKHSGSTALPYSISDVKLSRRQPLLDALEQILALMDSRFEADKLLALLDNQLILDTFQIRREDLPLLHDTASRLNIRWGSDAAERAEYGDVSGNLFTWQQGLQRLILGFMLPENRNHSLWQNIASYVSHPDHLSVLSRFATLVQHLSRTKTEWQRAASIADWCNRVRQLIAALITPNSDDDRAALQQLENALANWQNEADTADFVREIPREIALQHITRFLNSQSEAGFLRGGITFCSMVPMRSLPFQAVCLLGMNDGDMPRNTKAAPFDLIARHPQKGDRSRRDDDRYLFLEAILSARSVLYLSYVGKDIRTDEERAPSTLLGELLDTVAELSNVSPSALQQNWVKHHPLQAFSRQYFSGCLKNDLTSARQDYTDALNNPLPPFAPFVMQPENLLGSLKTDDLTTISQADFLRFWRNPVRVWLHSQLNWQAPYTQSAHEADEPFMPDQPRQIVDAYIAARKNGDDFAQVAQILSAQSLLPTGELGELVKHDYAAQAAALPSELLSSPKQPEQAGELHTVSGCLSYRLAHLYAHGQIVYATQLLNERTDRDKLSAADKVDLLLQHLIYCAATPDDAPHSRDTHYISLPECFRLPEIPQQLALDSLAMWLAAYHVGQNTPLPFFPRVNLAAASEFFTAEQPDWDKAIAAAAKKYHGGFRGFAQKDYPEVQLVFERGNVDDEPPYQSPQFEYLTQNLFAVFSGCLKALANKEDDEKAV
ncbi:exodeoxyribonuclease V subunit gamma [Wielerella bovis]|uniref:exodeoxyribonuclease V subunit gamma n=1 Tax=Wielerella bovis TaxID=2917790 RepID=UPI00201A0A11|nr:exodeoxyribonuclease V subunit gamma [Wielerella bovis]ULJ60738.1 exodeoxyribonuclease V subunit gamma [Wielerella bovis]